MPDIPNDFHNSDEYDWDSPSASVTNKEVKQTAADSNVDIMIADDVHANVFMIENMLSDEYTTASAEKASDFWITILRKNPRLLLLDLMMPVQDGFQILKMMKENEKLCHIPVIVVSAKDSKKDVLTAMSLGAVDYIIKPFKEKVLLEKIKNILEE